MSSGFPRELFFGGGRPSLAVVAGFKKKKGQAVSGSQMLSLRWHFSRHLHLLAQVLLQQSPPGGVEDHLQRVFFRHKTDVLF